MHNLNKLIREVLKSRLNKQDCGCGCSGKCSDDKAPVINENLIRKPLLSEHLQYHVNNKKPLTENTFRYGSEAFLNLWAEARKLYSRNLLEVSGLDKDIITETNLGEYGVFEGQKVPLDLPMVNEAQMLDGYEVDFFHTKANVYANIEIPSENPTFEDDIQIKGTGKTEEEAFEDLKRNYENYKKTGIYEAKEDVVDTITMDVPLFLRMLEYSREDASQDMDLHDVTEKAISLGKERGILQMDDYDEIIGANKEIEEGFYGRGDKRRGLQNQSKLSSAEYQKAKKLKSFKASDWKWNASEDLYNKVNEGELTEAKSFTIDSESASDSDKITDFLTKNDISFKKVGSKIKISLDRDTPKASSILNKLKNLSKFKELNEAELTEAYVPSNIKEFAKRKGVSSLVNKVAGWAEKVGKGIRGGTAIGYNYSTLILDMTYQGSEIRINTNDDTVTLYDEPVYSFNDFKQVYLDNQDESDNGLEERIAEALNKINEELCPAGKAYIKRRQAAGEKSSAYLSGRGVKVCKGLMSGKKKKK